MLTIMHFFFLLVSFTMLLLYGILRRKMPYETKNVQIFEFWCRAYNVYRVRLSRQQLFVKNNILQRQYKYHNVHAFNLIPDFYLHIVISLQSKWLVTYIIRVGTYVTGIYVVTKKERRCFQSVPSAIGNGWCFDFKIQNT